MIRVKVIERRLPHGWETLLEVNGAIGRAEEMLCLEEIPLVKLEMQLLARGYKFLPFTHATALHVAFAPFEEA